MSIAAASERRDHMLPRAKYLTRRDVLRRGAAGAMLALGSAPLEVAFETCHPAQTRRPAMSTTAFSKQRLERLHRVISGYVERGDIPGAITLVARRGEVHVDVMGVMASGSSARMRRDTIFRISSLTKPITAAAALILVEECRLRLDEPIDHFLPELRERRVVKRIDGPIEDTVPAHRPITLRDLLTFRLGFGQSMLSPDQAPIVRAGIDARIGMGPPEPANMPAPDEWLRRLGALPLMFQPGERWLYNTGSDVLGVLIARATGQSLEQFLRERLFEPLGMKDTSFSVPETKLERFATSYIVDSESRGLALYDNPNGQWSKPPAFESGGAGLCSTIDDYFAFANMLRNHGRYAGGRILSRAAVETMTTDQLTPQQKAVSGFFPSDFDAHGWGFGVSVVTRREELWENVGNYGWDGGMGTGWRNDPKEDMITLFFTQRAWEMPKPPAQFHDFWNSAYQAIED
jgi:CubicO group peptidase (beta-lactamase class C family)